MSKYTKKAIFQMRLKSITFQRDPSVFWIQTGTRHNVAHVIKHNIAITFNLAFICIVGFEYNVKCLIFRFQNKGFLVFILRGLIYIFVL